MSDHRYRYKAVLGVVFTEASDPLSESLRQLAAFIQQDDGPAIVAWLQMRLREAVQDLRDFRHTYRKLDARSGRLRTWLMRLEDELDKELDADDRDWERYDELSDEQDEVRGLLEDPELGWYEDEVLGRAGRIRTWRQRIILAKDIAGIELIPTRRRDLDED